MSDKHLHVFINKQKYELRAAEQTGRALKDLAGIPLGDVLFLQQKGDDLVIPNEGSVTLKNGDRLHSQPSADYGLNVAQAELDPVKVEFHTQPGGWTFLVVNDFELPNGYEPRSVKLLIKLPPLFPDAAPDMFWVMPAVRTSNGSLPRATSIERVLRGSWQRFSWHLAKGTWKPGESDLRDYVRCIRGRFLRGD